MKLSRSPAEKSPAPPQQVLLRVLGSHALAQALAGGVLAVIGLARLEGASSMSTIAMGFGLGVIPGTAVGVLCGVLACLCVLAPRIAVWIAIAVGFAVGQTLTELTGVAAVLFTRATPLSALAAAALTTGAVGVAVAISGLTPRHDASAGWLLRAGRGPTLIGLLVVFALIGVMTEARVPDYYRALRSAAVMLGSSVLGLALQVATAGLLKSRWHRGLVAALVWLSPLLPLLLLTAQAQTARLHLSKLPITRSGIELTRALTDTDGDGASRFLGDGDCAPDNPAVSPRAREQPGNSLDDDCAFGDAPLDPPTPPLATTATPSPLSVVLITVDAVRVDRTSLHHAGPDTTPALAAWARDGTVFEQAYATSTRTCSSVASLLRGVFPLQLPWTQFERTQTWRELIARYPNRTPPALWMCGVDTSSPALPPTLAERLRSRGMHTAAITNDDNTLVLSREAFGAGFEEYHDGLPNGDSGVVERAEAVLQRLGTAPQRFFLWVHLYGAHQTHSNVDPNVVDNYDHGLRAADRNVKQLLSAVAQLPDPGAVLTIVTSDHGETFGATARGHGSNLSEQELRVPLVLRGPGVPAARIARPVSLVDIAPTVLALTQSHGAAELPGQSLLGTEEAPRVLHADVWNSYLGYAYSAAMGPGEKVNYDHRLRTWSVYETSAAERHTGELSAGEATTNPTAQALHRYLQRNHAHLSP